MNNSSSRLAGHVLLALVEDTLRITFGNPDAQGGEAGEETSPGSMAPVHRLPTCLRQYGRGGERERIGDGFLRGRPRPATGKTSVTSTR